MSRTRTVEPTTYRLTSVEMFNTVGVIQGMARRFGRRDFLKWFSTAYPTLPAEAARKVWMEEYTVEEPTPDSPHGTLVVIA